MTTVSSTISFLCRDMRHAWEPNGDSILIETQGRVRVFSRTLRCPRCETSRTDIYRLAGHAVFKVSTHYAYPRGYQVKGGIRLEDVRYQLFHDAPMTPREDR